MKKIHDIQLEMFLELKKVMEKLNIKYYFIHGSLLGAVTRGGFIDEDDDIDIAIFREDYNKLIRYGNDYLPDKYFIQSSLNDDFPLSFAKMRNNQTTFIQPILNKCNCNKGIYIDIFPIDYVSKNIVEKFIEKFLDIRIKSRLSYPSFSLTRLIFQEISFVFFPSYNRAIEIREKLFTNRHPSEYVRITGGKLSERYLPLEWFGEGITKKFCNVDVVCPSKYEEYLTKVYGEKFHSINPAKDRIYLNNLINISANILDFEKSYKEYEISSRISNKFR